MNEIRQKVNSVRSRQQRQWLWRSASWGLVWGGCVGVVLAFARLLTEGGIGWDWILGAVVGGPVLGTLWATVRPCGVSGAASAIDSNCGLKDRVASALSFIDNQQTENIHALQITDAQRRVENLDATQVAPIQAPRSWFAGLGIAAAALVITFLTSAEDEAAAGPVELNPVIATQADRVEKGLRELEEFNEDQADPELKKLLEELAKTLEEMKEPSNDASEALAKLSEMEAALEERQKELTEQDSTEAFQEIGTALSLAEAMKAAGQAMSQGRMEEAADELAKMEMPKLDRQTERAVTEKLDELRKNDSNGMPKKLTNAASKLSSGLSNGSRKKFMEGAKSLAGECSKQGRRKKLLDLLKKQCKCLCECKSQCENCQNPSTGKGKGGKNWGLGSSGNEPGAKTAKLATNPKLEIKGKHSEDGDVDIETIQSGEQEEQATREYRQRVEKYKQLSESVLDSEPIPLGHRQTIRRYFELIRPTGNEGTGEE